MKLHDWHWRCSGGLWFVVKCAKMFNRLENMCWIRNPKQNRKWYTELWSLLSHPMLIKSIPIQFLIKYCSPNQLTKEKTVIKFVELLKDFDLTVFESRSNMKSSIFFSFSSISFSQNSKFYYEMRLRCLLPAWIIHVPVGFSFFSFIFLLNQVQWAFLASQVSIELFEYSFGIKSNLKCFAALFITFRWILHRFLTE